MVGMLRGVTLVALAAAASSIDATTLPIVSGDGTETCVYGPALSIGGTCLVQVIERLDPAWQTANALGQGERWISYADTGPQGSTLAPPRGSAENPDGTTVVAVFKERIAAMSGDILDLYLWADDTVRIAIDGLVLMEPCFVTAANFLCPNTPTAFDPLRGGYLEHHFGAAGSYDLTFEVYQIGVGTTPSGNPFGLMYSGELTSAVPLPGALSLFVSGLAAAVGAGFWLRRSCRRSL